MISRILLAVVIAVAQLPAYRPSSLGDMVDAVGANRDGLEDVDLDPMVDDAALFLGDAVGFAARTRDDPGGTVFVAWRRPGELWRYREIDAIDLDPVAIAPAAGRVFGRIEAIRQLESHVVIETRSAPRATSFVVLTPELTVTAFAAGTPRVSSPSGSLVIERGVDAGGVHGAELVLLAPASRAMTAIYSTSPTAAKRDAAISSVRLDEKTDTLRFTVTFTAPGGGDEAREQRQMVCTSISTPARSCSTSSAQ